MPLINALDKHRYYQATQPMSVDGKSKEQLERMVRGLKCQVDILNGELKSKQIVIDIKTREAENLKHVVDLLLDAAALANMAMKERG